MAAKRGSPGSTLTTVVGGMLVGLDEQLLRSTPRAEILVERGKSLRGLSAEGGTLLVGLPDDPIAIPERPVEDAAPAATGAAPTAGTAPQS